MNTEDAVPVRIVLVAPTHPGNIGAVARAMKTMCLSRLWLVSPQRFPGADATARAAGADNILYDAVVCDSLDEAIRDCHWVVGTSARERRIGWPVLEPGEFAAEARERAVEGNCALVFGRERAGLSNEELDRCHALVAIPSNPRFSSLNLASAVQVLAYELYRAFADAPQPGTQHGRPKDSAPLATSEEMAGMYEHMERALIHIGYLDPEAPKLLMRRLRRIFNRVHPDRSEVNILRGILSAAERPARD